MEITFPYSQIPPLTLPDSSPISVLTPTILSNAYPPPAEIITNSLHQPVNSPEIRELVAGKNNALILVDDFSRHTPTHIILPILIDELNNAGIQDKNIRILVASGTHRPMSSAEKRHKYSAKVVERLTILDHVYNDENKLAQLPTTSHGTEIYVNKLALETDLLIGIGHVVPHRVAGFSGGGKIVQPGICGAITTGQTHWLSAQFPGSDIIGRADNPVRREIEEVADIVGLKFIINVVMDAHGRTAYCYSGEPSAAFHLAAEKSLEIFGVHLENPANIVIADSYPADSDLWIAAKGIYSGDLALKKGGVLIFVSPCPEGVSTEYPDIEKIGYHPFSTIQKMVSRGEITNLALAAHLVHVGNVISEKASCILVSPGISPDIARKIGFIPASNPQQAWDIATDKIGKDASVVILKNGSEIMPVINSISS